MSEQPRLAANGGRSNVVSINDKAKTSIKPPPMPSHKHDAMMSTQALEQVKKPLLSDTQIRGVAELSFPESAVANESEMEAKLRSDRSVMFEIEAFRRDPVWRVEKLSRETADATTRGLSALGEWLEKAFLATMTATLSGTRSFIAKATEISKEAWASSRALAQAKVPNRASLAPPAASPFKACELHTVAGACLLRVKADADAPVAAEVDAQSQLLVFTGYAAPQGWLLAQRPSGEIGFIERASVLEEA